MQDDLRIVGPFHACSGYASFCRAALSTARLAGYRVQAIESDFRLAVRGLADGSRLEERIPLSDMAKVPPEQAAELQEAKATTVHPGAPTLFVQLPVQLGGWSEYSLAPRIGWTMIESDTLHPLWARAAANVDGLLLPSRLCFDAFSKAIPGVSKDRLPLPVDPRLYSPEGPRAAFGNRPDFLFFSSFATCERKGWRLLMQAFTEEFYGESVGLVVLPSKAAPVQELAQWCRHTGAWIHVLDTWVSQEDLAGLYRACDAFALPSAEGFGLPFVEAALCGKPSVALNSGGAAEIVTEATGYPIEAVMAPCIGHLPPLYDSTHRFPTATVAETRRALRACVEDRGKRGEAAREYALARFTPEALAPKLRDAVEEAVCRHRTEHAVWVGTNLAELPSLSCLVLARDKARALSCRAHLREYQPRPRVEFVCAEEDALRFDHEPFWLADTPAAAIGSALEQWKREGFTGYVAILRDTVTVLPDWWHSVCKVFALRPDVGIVAPKRVFEDGQCRVGGHLTFDGSREASRLERAVVTCDYADQSCLILRPEVWPEVAIDPALGWHYWDADVCVQARRLGYETAATARAEVRQTLGERDKDYLLEALRQQFLRKWRGDF